MMKRTITLSLTTALILGLCSWMAPIQAQSEEQIKQFNQERETYFTEKLELTPGELESFWPVYNDFNNRKMKLSEEERNTFKYCHKNADNLTDEEFVEALEKIRELKDKKHKLEQKYYHEKFPGVLPPKKVMMLYKVEWDFRSHLLRQIRGHGSREGRSRSGGRSGQGHGPEPAPLPSDQSL